jgi:histidinol-phosphate aminotransferase
MILAGNGSDDILTIVTRTFVPPGGVLAFPEPTYSLYKVLAGIEDATVKTTPWGENWSLPADALLALKPDAIFLTNPNAPSGTFVPPAEIAKLAERFSGLLLVDEAYVDFADDNCLALVQKHANVVVSRTLSKAYSLAGLRFGYAVAQPQVVEQMMKVKDSYNCDAIAIAAAAAAIADQDYARQSWDHVRQERARLTEELTTLGLTVVPSHANFVLAEVPDGRAGAMYQSLKAMGILIRYFNAPGLDRYIRITIGTAQENNALLCGIRELLAKEKAA